MNNKEKSKIKKYLNLAFQNHQKNNFLAAENTYKKILEIEPNHFESNFYLGTLFLQIKKFNLAESLLQKALIINPHHSMTHNNIGSMFRELGEYQKATLHYEKAVKINPNYAEAFNNLGGVFRKLEKYQKAVFCYEKAIQVTPENINIQNNLGTLFHELGEYQKALICYEKIIQINPNHPDVYSNLGAIFKIIQLDNIKKYNIPILKKLFLFLLRKNEMNHSEIFHNVKLLLLTSEDSDKLKKGLKLEYQLLTDKTIKNLAKEEIFLLILQKSIIIDSFLEKLLTKLRYEILLTLNDSNPITLKEYLNFSTSLAEQCWLNEYVYTQTEKEIGYVNKLKDKIEKNKKINELEISILGCYIPLLSSEIIAKKLLNYKSTNILFTNLIIVQIKEPLKERELLDSIESLGKIINPISNKVREQYEEHPYPRWKYTYRYSPNNFLQDLTNDIKPNKIKYIDKFINPNVLIAGCGTGNHTIYATKYQNAKILGVDLSLKSLSYAKRKAEELNIKNIEFLHADILQLKNLNKKYDVIESIGTLHHMEKPEEGLKVLVDILKPHGFIKIGLYSDMARDYVTEAKKLIKEKNFKSTELDIRKCRDLIFNEKKNLILQKIIHRGDFYSTSNVRDLLFHVQEHRFTIPKISEMLQKLNLEFLGFINPAIKRKFFKYFPIEEAVSLDSWNKFETSNPNTFRGMYQFWIRKK